MRGSVLHAHGLVGRKAELEEIERFLDTVSEGPGVLVLEGDPGIGKTELWTAGLAAARARGFDVRTCRSAQAEAKLSLSALIDLLDPLPEAVVEGLAPPRRDALLAALLRAPPTKPSDQRTLGVAVLDVFRGLSAERPLLIAIDDEQWLDRSSAAVLAFALRRLQGEPVGSLSTRRSEVAPSDGDGRVVPAHDAHRLPLGPLDLDAIDTMIEERLGVALPLPTLHRVYEISGGNPLFALEIVRGLPPQDMRIPAGELLPVAADLRDRFGRRLERLPASTRDALLVAAIAAEPSIELIASVTGNSESLAPAIAGGVVELIGDTVCFTHPLLAAVSMGVASEHRRREVHRTLAATSADPEARARHLALAAEGPDAGVAIRLDDAARSGRARGAFPDAAELSELAIRLTPPDHADDLARRRIDASAMHFLAGDDVAGIAIIDEVLETITAGPLRAEAICIRARRTFEDVARTVSLLEDALSQEGLAPGLEADLHVHYAWTLWRAADPETALRHAHTALELAEAAHDPRMTCDALVIRGALTWALGRARSDASFRRALELEPEVREGWFYVGDRPSLVVADVLGHDARFEEATSIFADLLRDARQIGDEPSTASVLWNLGTLEILSGDWHRAREHLSEAVRLRRQEGMRPMESLASLAMLRASEGHIDEAQVEAAEALATSIDWCDLEAELFCLQAAGLIELTDARADAACEPLTRAAGLIRSSALRSPDLCSIVADEIEALLAAGRTEEAEPEVAWLEDWTQTLGGWTGALARRSRGHVLAARGDLDGARATLERAVAELERVGIPFECGRALLVLGAVERRAKQKRAAREAFGRAVEIFDSLDAPVWADRARCELARIGGRAPAPRELTEAERQVAELVAAGRSNREVAEVLFMSPRTVESHLTRVYTKLGIHSRTELAATLLGGER